jgi:hypothetical protein
VGQALGAYLKVLVKTCGEALKVEETTEKWGQALGVDLKVGALQMDRKSFQNKQAKMEKGVFCNLSIHL